MSKLTSMKMTKAERDSRNEPKSVIEDTVYPWGLQIRLDTEALEKLAIDKMPEVGDEMTVVARVKVSSVSSNESTGGKNKNLELQITDMCLEKEGAKAAADALYAE